jgi:EpsI family protein
MSSRRMQALIALVLMVATFAGAAAWRPTIHLADQMKKVDLEQLFPRQVGGWTVDDRMPVQLISPDTAAVLNAIYNQTLSRTYVNREGQRIMLSVAYGGDQSDATRAHRPEVCYPAQGFEVLSAVNTAFDVSGQPHPVRRLVTKLGARVEPLSYWIMVGNRATLTGTEQKLAQLAYGYKGMIADGMIIRVSMIDADPKKAFAVQDAFVAALYGVIDPASRSRVFGLSSHAE